MQVKPRCITHTKSKITPINEEFLQVLSKLVDEISMLRQAVEGLNECIDDMSSTDLNWTGGGDKALQVMAHISGDIGISGESDVRIQGISINGEYEGAPLSDVIEYRVKEPLKQLGKDNELPRPSRKMDEVSDASSQIVA